MDDLGVSWCIGGYELSTRRLESWGELLSQDFGAEPLFRLERDVPREALCRLIVVESADGVCFRIGVPTPQQGIPSKLFAAARTRAIHAVTRGTRLDC